ncbi:MAG: hypothetical protein RLZ28_6 [Actinomycetota bacterium]|jgi:hypothetical protein
MNSTLESADFAVREIARKAAVETAGPDAVGVFVESVVEADGLTTYSFESKLKGYPDWFWAVVVFSSEGQAPTISEVVLVPTGLSLQAPAWVPWSERLADYQALQAELEAAAEAAEAEAAESAEAASDEVDDDNFVDFDEDDLALSADVDESKDSKRETNGTGRKLPGFNLLSLLRGKKKK